VVALFLGLLLLLLLPLGQKSLGKFSCIGIIVGVQLQQLGMDVLDCAVQDDGVSPIFHATSVCRSTIL
jgi:hypothetical protein